MTTLPPAGRITAVNDIEMYCELRGQGEPLLLLHGGGGVGANWSLLFAEPPQGFALIVPDLRGHGRSTHPTGRLTFRQAALDVFALLDTLEIERFKAVGLSLGAKTLLHMATQQPKRVDAMVLVSAAPYFPAPARAAMAQLTPETRSAAEWEQMRQWHPRGDEQIRNLWRQLSALQADPRDLSFTPPLLATIEACTLLVHGDRDPFYPARLAVEMYEAIPRAYLWIVPNGGHGPIFGDTDDSKRRFVETTLAFLRGAWT
ncbi:MAG TPA: alpha/beta fold hydrolase [Thermoanaerobaculia bacterium]|nr:alpha/beta fold hydrolase [Thermoanaerobaculia bacterium]